MFTQISKVDADLRRKTVEVKAYKPETVFDRILVIGKTQCDRCHFWFSWEDWENHNDECSGINADLRKQDQEKAKKQAIILSTYQIKYCPVHGSELTKIHPRPFYGYDEEVKAFANCPQCVQRVEIKYWRPDIEVLNQLGQA